MLLTIIVFYSFIVRCLKRENKLIGSTGKTTSIDSATNSISSHSITTNNSSTSSSAANSIAYNHLNKNHQYHHHHYNRKGSVLLINRGGVDKDELRRESSVTEETLEGAGKSKEEEDNAIEETYSDDEVADDNQFDEEEFYNIIATKAAAFQSKRNSSTSTVSSGSMYDDTYRTKRHSLRSQSSTCSDIMETSVMSTNTTRRSSEESCRLQNRKLNYKSRRHGFQTLSKRRRTTGRYFSHLSTKKIKFSLNSRSHCDSFCRYEKKVKTKLIQFSLHRFPASFRWGRCVSIYKYV
jgi:hypothetical protein